MKLARQNKLIRHNVTQNYGLTLVELLIVVAIVAILAGVAYPSYQRHMTSTRHADAKVKLLEIMQAQRRFFTDSNTYTTNLTGDLGYADAGSGAVATDNEFYTVQAGQCGTEPLSDCVLLTASPNFGDGTDSSLTYNTKNEKKPAYAW